MKKIFLPFMMLCLLVFAGKARAQEPVNNNGFYISASGWAMWNAAPANYPIPDPGDECVIESVEISGFVEPVAGEAISTNLTVTADNYSVGLVEWYDNASFDPMAEGATFEDGHSYYMIVTLVADDECVASDNCTYAINDDAALVDANPSHTYFLDGVFTVSTIDFEVTSGQPGDECILNEFYVSLDEPVENGTPSATMASVDPDADYTIGDVEWYESTSFSPMEEGETFQSGHSYYCYFALTPKDDCVIDDNYTIYVNNEANTEYDFADNNVLYVYSTDYTVESGQPQDCVISEFYVSLDEPVENEDPSTATASVDPDADYTISNVYWYESTELDPMADGETFQSGHEYYCTFSLTPKGDCVIDDTYTIFVNGEANTEYDFADENVLYVYSANYAPESGQPQTCTIETVGLTGVVEPVFGATVSYNGIAAGSDDYEITSLGWYSLTSSDPLEEGDTFGEGTYYLYAQLEPKEGCTFDDESVAYFINTTANFADAEWCGYNESIGFYLNSVLFELAGPGDECVIETINILGFEEPVFGEEISYDGLSLEDDNCTLAAQWLDGDWNPVTTTTFESGSYFLYFEVKANTGCEYASNVGLAINGESNLVFRSGFMNDSTIYIYTNGFVVVDPTVDCSGFETSFEYGFCDWTTLDADGDGFTWELGGASTSAHNGEFSVYSESYDPNEGELHPDNYLISPKTLITAEKPVVGFWACAQDASWAAEVFSLGVSTTTADAGEFTMLDTWTMTAKKTANTKGVTRGNAKVAGNWYYYSVDLSEYIDSEVYVCIRHHDCSDNFFLNVDDIAFTEPAEPVEPATSLFNDFENGFDGWTFTSMNTTNGIGGTGSQPAGIFTNAAHDGSYGLKFSSYTQASNYNQYLISPELAGEEVTMSFYYAVGSSYSPGESFKVGYSTTDNSISSFIFGDEITANSTTWNQSEDFVFPEGTKYVAINYCSNYQYYMYVDDISVGNDNGKKVIANYASSLNKHVIAANSREAHLAYMIKVSADKANNSVKVSNGTQKMVAENARKAIAMNSTKMKVAENARKAVAAKSSIDKKSVAAKHSFRSVAEKHGLKHNFNKVNAWGVKAKDNAYAWDFENDYYADELIDWTTIDADGDGYDWTLFGETVDASINMSAHSGLGMVYSESYNQVALLPDNYLVSPQTNINDETRTFKFWASAQDAGYPAEHFGVAISTDGNTDAADFTTIQEWTMTAKSDAKAQMSRTKANGRGNNRVEGEWYEYSVDLSDYMGQDVYVAIRHFGCTDKYILKVDDISFDGEVLDPFVGYNLSLDGELVAEGITDLEYYMQEAETFADGTDHIVLAEAVYKSGNTLSIEQEWTYMSGEHFTPAPEGLTASIDGYTANLSWEIPSAGIVPSTFYYDFADGTMGEFTVLNANSDNVEWTASTGAAYISFATAGNDDYLISPLLTLGDDAELSFLSACYYSSSYPETFEVRISTTGTAAEDFSTLVATETVSSTSGEVFTYDLSDFAGQQVYIAIRNISVDQWRQYVTEFTVTNVMMENNHIGAIVYRNDEIIAKLQNGETSYADEFNGADTPEYCIRIIQNGSKEDGTFYALAEKQCAEQVVYVCQVPENVNVVVDGNNATVAWEGDAAEYVVRYKPYTGPETATVTLTAGDVWGDGSGYQLLLDADANAFGTIIPETGPLTTSGNASAATYAEFEYKIPEDADGALTTSNIVVNNSITIEIPAGVYDWCVTNPTAGDRMWIAGNGRADDFEFEAGKTYEFTVTLISEDDGDNVDITISEGKGAKDGEEEWTVVDGITENSYTIEGLTEGTQYIVEVQAICSDGGVSDWTDGEVFYIEDPNACYAPENLEASILVHNATLTWEMGNTMTNIITGYNVYRSTDGINYEIVANAIEDMTYTDEGLEVGLYYYQVTALNERSNGTTCESDPVEITVEILEPECPAPYNLEANVDGSTVTLTWEMGADAPLSFSFENGLDGWTTFEGADAESSWLSSDENPGGYDYTGLAYSGTGFAMSYSYIDYVGAYQADNYMVSPEKYAVGEDAQMTFFYDFGNDQYPDFFTVEVSTGSNDNANDFTAVWASDAKGGNNNHANVRKAEGTRYENWREINIDLSAYAGQNIWVAFHHTDNDNYEVWIDDVTFTNMGTASEGVFRVYRSEDGETYELVANNVTETTYTDENLADGTHYYQVTAINTLADGSECESEPAEVNVTTDGMNDYANGEIKVYPNPTKANVTIEAEGMSRVIVMNALGQVVYEANVTDNTVINMGQFGSGVYMVNITTSNGVTVKRVTVAK